MNATEPAPNEAQSGLDIAIVGVSALFPGSSDARGFWQDILEGRDRIGEVPPTHWRPEDYYSTDPTAEDRTWCTRGGFLDPVDFPALELGVPPNTAPATDSSQLLALVVARQVLDDATRGRFASMDRERVSVILGVTGGQELMGHLAGRLGRPQWRHALLQHGLPESEVEDLCQRIADQFVPWQEASFPGLLGNVVAGRIAHRLDLGGTNCVVDAACASALSALKMAVDELLLGHSDLVITGGVDTMNDPFMFMCFTRTPALSKAGDCRPFDADGDGTLLGEGVGMVALKRLADAERDGDRIYAVIKGVGSSSDGLGPGIYAPVAEGQAKALRRAYAAAGYGPETVELVEAHGTGTRAGDAAESRGLRMVFEEAAPGAEPWCALGSVKAQIGHTKAAAGAAGLIKAVLALHQRALPPAIKVRKPNPALDGAPFSLLSRARPWIRGDEHPRRASVSAFGFGGSNFHVALEEYTGPNRAERLDAAPVGLALIGAEDRAGLIAAAQAMAAEAEAGAPLHVLARRSQQAWKGVPPWRLAVTAKSGSELAGRLRQAVHALETENGHGLTLPRGVWSGRGALSGKVALLFPGQGSQAVEMGRELALAFPAARAVWDRADRISAAWGRKLSRVVYPPRSFDPTECQFQVARLTDTAWAQPALAVASLAGLAVLEQLGLHAELFLGHSFGELVALHAAGAYDEDALIQVARARGEAMAAAGRASGDPGTMAAVIGDAARVVSQLAQLQDQGLGEGVVVANHNAPDQVVLAGPAESLGEISEGLQHAGLMVRPLQVAAAFHSPLVAGASEAFAVALEGVEIGAAERTVIGNTDAGPYPDDPDAIRARLAEQLARPVRFAEGVFAAWDAGARVFVEVGPGSVLSSLAGRVLAGREALIVSLDRADAGLDAALEAIGRLAVAGVPLNPAALWEGVREDAWPPAKKRGMVLKISGTNPGRPYPPQGDEPVSAPAPRVSKPLPTKEETPMPEPVSAPAQEALAPAPVAYQGALVSGETVAWMAAWQEVQRQTSATHVAFQQAMHDAHLAYLRAMETSFQGLAALAGVSVAASAPVSSGFAPVLPAPAPVPVFAAPVYAAPPPAPVVVAAPAPAPVVVAAPAPAPVVAAPAPALVAPAPAPAPAPKAAKLPERPVAASSGALGPSAAPAAKPAPAAGPNLEGLLMEVVADKTGYPAEMLDLSMGLASDLGIDSIKRVEILSALRAKVPSLPELDMAGLASLRTLAQVLETLQGAAGGSAAAPSKDPENRRYLLGRSTLPQGEVRALPRGTRRLGLLRDPGGVAEALAARLGVRGIAVTLYDVGEPEPTADGFVVLAGLGPWSDELAPQAAVRAGFRAARTLARQVRAGGGPGIFVTVQDTGGDFSGGDARRALAGGLTGITRTLARELPATRALALDVEVAGRSPDAVAAQIEQELFFGGSEIERGLTSDGRRLGLVDLEAPPLRRWGRTSTASDSAASFEAHAEGRVARGVTLSDEGAKGGLPRVNRPVAGVAARGVGPDASLVPGDVVVVTGGARGVTARCLIALLEQVPLRLVLLGRTPLEEEPAETRGVEDEAGLRRALLGLAKAKGEALSPAALAGRAAKVRAAREARENLDAMTARGGEVRYLAVDVQDRAALAAGLAEVRRVWGPIAGVVHGAGVLADALLADKEDAAFDRVFDTKVTGFLNLLAVTEGDPLVLVAAFSSVAGRYGNPGQGDYAAANEVLNQRCQVEAARRPGARVVSLDWGPWDGGMVTPELRAMFAARGVPLLAPDEGARLFVEEALAAEGAPVMILGGRLVSEPAPTPDEPWVEEVLISAATHPWLVDHSVQDQPVLPVVQVVELFASALGRGWPGLRLQSLEKLKVLRGVPLPEFARGHRFRVEARPQGGGRIALALYDAEGGPAPRYRAEALLGLGEPVLAAPDAPAGALSGWEGDPYAEALFHGPAFQALSGTKVGEGGATAEIAPLRRGDGLAPGWMDDAMATDPLALDAALQLGLLWGWTPFGGRSLPTGIGALKLGTPGAWRGPVTARLRVLEADGRHARFQIGLTGEDRLLAVLDDVEFHAVPSAQRSGQA